MARARREAQSRGLVINYAVSDMRDCLIHGSETFDVLLCADNSITHLESISEITRAVKAFHGCLRPGGIAITGIRDYAVESDRTSPQMRPYGFRKHAGQRYFVFQTRDMLDNGYEVAMYFVREAGDKYPASVIAGTSRYYFLYITELMRIFREAGFYDVRCLDDVMHQPLVVGRRPD